MFFNFSHEAHTFRGLAMKYGPMQITDQDSHDNDVMCCCYRKKCREGGRLLTDTSGESESIEEIGP